MDPIALKTCRNCSYDTEQIRKGRFAGKWTRTSWDWIHVASIVANNGTWWNSQILERSLKLLFCFRLKPLVWKITAWTSELWSWLSTQTSVKPRSEYTYLRLFCPTFWLFKLSKTLDSPDKVKLSYPLSALATNNFGLTALRFLTYLRDKKMLGKSWD